MELKKVRTVTYDSTDWHNILSILAYVSGKVEYKPEAEQHSKLKKLAFDMHSDLCYQDDNESI